MYTDPRGNKPTLGSVPDTTNVGAVSLALILGLGLALRLWNIDWGLPEIYEEARPLFIAMKFWNPTQGSLDLNPHFFLYPALSFYLHFIVQTIHYLVGHFIGTYENVLAFQSALEKTPAAFLITARLFEVLLDLGTIMVTFLLARKVVGLRAALVAAFLVAINILHIQQAHLIHVHTQLTFFVTLCLYFLYEVYTTGSTRSYVFTGIAAGLAAASNYNGVFLLPALLGVHLLRSTSLQDIFRNLRSWRLLYAVILSGTVFVLFNPYILLDYESYRGDMEQSYVMMSQGSLGMTASSGASSVYFTDLIPANLGWPLMIVVAASLIVILLKRKKGLVFLAIFPVTYLCVVVLWQTKVDRYLLPAIPSLLMIGSWGLVRAWDTVATMIRRFVQFVGPLRAMVQGSAFILCGGVVIGPSVARIFEYQHSLGLPDSRGALRRWIDRNIPHGSAIAVGSFASGYVSEESFLVLPIPYINMMSETLAPFYDIRWYEDFDVVITSNYDYSRYLAEPKKYGTMLPYFDSLRTRWTLLQVLDRTRGLGGPTFEIYRPSSPATSTRFDESLLRKVAPLEGSEGLTGFLGLLADILARKGRLEKSEQLLACLVTIDPSSIQAQSDLATLRYRSGNMAGALKPAEVVLQLQPEHHEMLTVRGISLIELGRTQEGEESLREAIRVNPQVETPYLALLALYSKTDDRNSLVDVLRRFLKVLPPESQKAKLVQDQLLGLKE